MDFGVSNTNAFPFIREASGIKMEPWEMKGGWCAGRSIS